MPAPKIDANGLPPAPPASIDADGSPRLLFVPVSGAFGMGEYARSAAIAQGAQIRWPSAAVRFLLSRDAPYASRVPFSVDWLPSSATFHSKAVIRIMEQWRPDVVIFDNAGRTQQLKAAKRLGAGVVYISARLRQRRKAFRFRWMRLIDEHWIAYPEFIAGRLNFTERCKLRLLHRPAVRYLDVILARYATASGGIVQRLGCTAGEYVLVVPGGGTGHPGSGAAVNEFLDAARRMAESGTPTVFVGPGSVAALQEANLVMAGPLPQADLADLMRNARLLLVNGGSTLLQAIASGKACIAVPIAGDQRERIRGCVSAGVAIAAPLQALEMVGVAASLLKDEQQRSALEGRAIALGLRDGVEVALNALGRIV